LASFVRGGRRMVAVPKIVKYCGIERWVFYFVNLSRSNITLRSKQFRLRMLLTFGCFLLFMYKASECLMQVGGQLVGGRLRLGTIEFQP
jgi:hypothetical protein